MWQREQGFVLIACLVLLTFLSLIVTGMMQQSRLHYRIQQYHLDSLQALTVAEMALHQGEAWIASIPVDQLIQLAAPNSQLPDPVIEHQPSHQWRQHALVWWQTNALQFDMGTQSAFYTIEWLGFIQTTVPDASILDDGVIGQYFFRVTSLGQGRFGSNNVVLQATWFQQVGALADGVDLAIINSQRLAWRQLG